MKLIVNILNYIPHVQKANAADCLDTAIGCLPTEMDALVNVLLRYSTIIGGMVAVAMLAVGGFGLMTSAGDPEKLMNARETINNALMGLALIVLSVFILELLGVEILGIGYLDEALQTN